MGSVVLQQSESSLLKDNSNNNNQQQYHSDQENLFMMIGKISRDNHHHSSEQQLLSTSSTAFERGDYSHQHDNIIDEAIVQDEGHQEFNYCDRTLLQQQSHLQLEEQQYDHEPTYENQTDDDVETLFLGSSSCEGSSTAIIIDKARKNNNTIRRILPPQTTFLEKESKLILPTTLTTIDTNNINYYHQYHHQQEYNDNRKQQALGMNERSNIENNAQSLVDQQEHQACEQEKQNTTLRKTCNEEILIHNSNDSIIIRSYNYETDEKQVNKIFVEGIKSIVPTYLQTFYLFIHHFGIIQVFAILSLFYISSFIFQFGIIKLLFNPDDSSTTINNHTSLLSIILSFTNLSASSTIYALISTFITCTSMVVLLVCGLSKYVDYSARSYIYQQFKFSDMSNIQKFYIWDEDNHFWVAQLKSTGEIVGTIGVRKRANQEETVELKRMSVSSSMKRKGIASLMLNHLVKWSKEKGYKTIVLSTSSLQAAAVDFYKKNGFSIVKMRRYSRFLPTAHLTFEKHL